jgi:ribokinase
VTPARCLVSQVRSAGLLLLQREVPESVSIAAAEAAHAAGVPVILDAGGDETPIADALLRCVTYLSPNETELARARAWRAA